MLTSLRPSSRSRLRSSQFARTIRSRRTSRSRIWWAASSATGRARKRDRRASLSPNGVGVSSDFDDHAEHQLRVVGVAGRSHLQLRGTAVAERLQFGEQGRGGTPGPGWTARRDGRRRRPESGARWDRVARHPRVDTPRSADPRWPTPGRPAAPCRVRSDPRRIVLSAANAMNDPDASTQPSTTWSRANRIKLCSRGSVSCERSPAAIPSSRSMSSTKSPVSRSAPMISPARLTPNTPRLRMVRSGPAALRDSGGSCCSPCIGMEATLGPKNWLCRTTVPGLTKGTTSAM